MCNYDEQQVLWAEYCKTMQALKLDVPTQQTEADPPQAAHIRINARAWSCGPQAM